MSDIAAWVGFQPPLQTDSQYCCPYAPIVLIAGNTLFRVHKWNILGFSGYFRAMAARCDRGDLEWAGPIECDVTPAVLRHYLEIIYDGRHSQWSDLEPPFRGDPVPLIECRKLARRWDCRMVEDVTQGALDARIRLDAWGMFKLASQLDDTELGAECVAAFAAGRVPPDIYWWRAELSESLLDVRHAMRG